MQKKAQRLHHKDYKLKQVQDFVLCLNAALKRQAPAFSVRATKQTLNFIQFLYRENLISRYTVERGTVSNRVVLLVWVSLQFGVDGCSGPLRGLKVLNMGGQVVASTIKPLFFFLNEIISPCTSLVAYKGNSFYLVGAKDFWEDKWHHYRGGKLLFRLF